MSYLIIGAICGLIGIPLGRYKNDWWRGMLVGLLLGPLGLIIMAMIPRSDRHREIAP